MNAVEAYLKEFYENPKFLEDYKINVLKSYYYKILMDYIAVNKINFTLDYDDFIIGVTFNKKFIFYKSRTDDRYEIVYNRVFDEYYVKYKNDNDKTIYIIDTLNDLNNQNINYEKNIIVKSSTKNIANTANVENSEDDITIVNNSLCYKKCSIM
jgi:hypothetical protein